MPNAEDTIRDLVSTHKVVLFMKGSRHFPQCGFSAQVVEILNQLLPAYETVNVLADQEVREGIKRYSDWPTIPQLYVDGKFLGGCDIVKEMFANGELATALGSKAASEPAAAPVIHVSARAAAAINAAKESPNDDLRIVVSPAFEHELYFDGAEPGDFLVEAGGVKSASARTAHDAPTASRSISWTLEAAASRSKTPTSPRESGPCRPRGCGLCSTRKSLCPCSTCGPIRSAPPRMSRRRPPSMTRDSRNWPAFRRTASSSSCVTTGCEAVWLPRPRFVRASRRSTTSKVGSTPGPTRSTRACRAIKGEALER